jgi:hypothetical protein
MDIKKYSNIESIKKMGRPKGSKNTPKRTLDLRDYIPPSPPKPAKFKITSSQRKLLKSFNPEGLLDFRTKEFKQLSYEDKENYILEQLSIAQENRKKNKRIVKNYIGDLKFNEKVFNLISIENRIREKVKKDYPNKTEIQQSLIVQKLLEEEKEEIIKFEMNRGYILKDDIDRSFYAKFSKELNDRTELIRSIQVQEERVEEDAERDRIFKEKYTKIYNELLKEYGFEIFKKSIINQTSYTDSYNNNWYFLNDILINYTINININEMKKYIDFFIWLGSTDDFSEMNLVFINKDYVKGNNYNEYKLENNDLKKIKMKDAYSCNIEGYDEQSWDTKNGKCVFDYIKKIYGNIKGFILGCSEEELINIFEDNEALINGVDTYQIENFCRKFNVPLYAFDDTNDIFYHYYPNKRNYNCPSMMFKISNNHFYPIPEKQRQSFINKADENYINYYKNKKEKFPRDNITTDFILEFGDLIELNNNENSISKLGEIINEHKKIPKIEMYSGRIQSITLDNNIIFFRKECQISKEIAKNMNVEYVGQTIQHLTSEFIKGKIDKSTPNNIVFNQLLEAKKNRSFNGLIKRIKINNNDDIIAYDINKCYSSVMYKPIEDWILLDIDNDWEDFIGQEIKLGLYYIETNDNILFKGNNIYSSAIVKKGLDENLISRFNIIKVLYANKKQDKKLFVNIIDDILKISNNNKDIYKKIINCISGMLGKSKYTFTKANINKSLEQIYIKLDEYISKNKDILPFMTKITNTDYYIYGYNKDVKMNDNNIPMYIQILDQANIKLYDMIKKADGELIGRKVDCAIIRNSKNKLICDDKWGDYRLSSIPKLENYEVNNNIRYQEKEEFKLYDNIIDSNDYEKILDICCKKGGCLLTGSAGTGKSYVINEISKKLNCAKITPTNKSALNIRGQTIHKFLKIDKDGIMDKSRLNSIKNKKYDLIIVDEISMINKELWRKLLILKDKTKINFLLVGDNKQLPPVENDGIERDYFNSSIVKQLINYNKIDLEVKKRYDEKLSKILDDIDNIDKKDLGKKCETKVNICFLNKTRKEVNKYWNNKEKKSNSILIKTNDDDMTQDIYIYEGLPLIARKNTQGGDEIINNEKFILDGYDNNYLFLSSERPNEEGDQIIHKIDIKINDIHKYFLLNYCSTTHKAQGETIKEKFTIYDFNYMSKKCKYTALSRAKSAEQIIINGEIIPNWKNF